MLHRHRDAALRIDEMRSRDPVESTSELTTPARHAAEGEEPRAPAARPWGREPGAERVWRGATLLLFVLLLALVALTFADYGVTFDEPLHQRYGALIVDYYLGLAAGTYDPGALQFHNLYLYGGLFDTLVALAGRVLPLPPSAGRHLLTALYGLLGVLGAARIAGLLGGPRAGFWAALLLALTPRYWGHMFNNPKDIPFAVGYVWALYALLVLLAHLPRPRRSLLLALGGAIGLALGVRVGGLLLLAYLVLVLAASWIAGRARHPPGRDEPLALARSFLLAALPAYLIMLLFWPWAQSAPLRRPLLALREISRFPWDLSVLWEGTLVPAPELPRGYAVRFLLITTPEIVLVLLALGATLGCAVLARGAASPLARARVGLLLLAVLFPVVWVAVTGAVLYDGVRHLLFVVPPLISLAALSLCAVTDRLRRRSPALGLAGHLVIIAALLSQATLMVRLHPYQTTYFNRLVGGLPGAAGRYETDYWGNSYREAVRMLVAYLESEGESGASYRIKSCSSPLTETHDYPPSFQPTRADAEAHFFIATTRWNCHESVDGEILLAVERLGVPLAIVKDRRHLVARSGPA